VTAPRRVRVVHPRMEAALRHSARPPVREAAEQTPLGEVYLAARLRSQRRLAGLAVGLIAVLLGGLALLGALLPAYGRWRAAGVPVCWLVLGLAVYPVLIALAAYLVRRAERNERDFADLLRER
jgi:hypothetical protein